MTREVLLDIINRQFQSLRDITDLSERAAGLGIQRRAVVDHYHQDSKVLILLM